MADALIFRAGEFDNQIEIVRTPAGFIVEIKANLLPFEDLQFDLTDAQMAELILWAKGRITERVG